MKSDGLCGVNIGKNADKLRLPRKKYCVNIVLKALGYIDYNPINEDYIRNWYIYPPALLSHTNQESPAGILLYCAKHNCCSMG